MTKHVYGIDPATGKPGHYKVDLGPARVPYLRGTPTVAASAKHSRDNTGRKIGGGTSS